MYPATYTTFIALATLRAVGKVSPCLRTILAGSRTLSRYYLDAAIVVSVSESLNVLTEVTLVTGGRGMVR